MPELTAPPSANSSSVQLATITYESSEKTPVSIARGDVLLGRYRLERVLGQGGMGVVWLAADKQLDEMVAIKFVPPEIRNDEDALNDLRRETQKSRKLSHPNIIRLHDLNQFDDAQPFITMEYVEGETLRAARIAQPNGVFSWNALRPLAGQLCAALDYAHSQGIVHRDLKPSNIMVTAAGQLKLADFGIAATISETMGQVSLENLRSGTPAYMSPQQIEGRPPSAKDDIYAFGATLYDLFSGKPPFFRGKVLHQVINSSPQPLEERLEEFDLTNPVPPRVIETIMACLAKDPDQRPQDMATVIERLDLEVGLVGKPVHATPVPSNAEEPHSETKSSGRGMRLLLGAVIVAVVASVLIPMLEQPSEKTLPAVEPDGAPEVPEISKDNPLVNSLGMKFVPVPDSEALFCIHETRHQDYQAFASENQNVDRAWQDQTLDGIEITERAGEHPVIRVSWNDAHEFCAWLGKREGRSYRLPTDEEWSHAVGIGPLETREPGMTPKRVESIQNVYSWGTEWPPPPGVGNVGDVTRKEKTGKDDTGDFAGYDDGYATTAPVMSFKPNRFGLYDLTGNVYEWCEDWIDTAESGKVIRGGCYSDHGHYAMVASHRPDNLPHRRWGFHGFRIVLVPDLPTSEGESP